MTDINNPESQKRLAEVLSYYEDEPIKQEAMTLFLTMALEQNIELEESIELAEEALAISKIGGG